MRTWKHMARGIAATVIALVIGACNDSTGPGLTGDFSANVTGDQTKALEGDAFFSFGTVFGEPESKFALMLLEGGALGESDGFILIAREQEGRPPVGTYAIADAEAPTAAEFLATWFPTGDVEGEFISTGGSVTITSSSSRRLRGTFEFDAIGTMGEDPTQLEVTVAGTFDAVFVNENGSPVPRVSEVRVKRATAR